MRFDLEDEEFRASATRWLASLDDSLIARFDAVMAVSPGYYPTTLHALWLEELDRRQLQPVAEHDAAARLLHMPVAHPADSDWRFTDASAAHLLVLAAQHLAAGACVVHIGAPSTFRLGVRTFESLRHVLLERAEPIIAGLLGAGHSPGDVLCLDVAQSEIPHFGAEAAIVDPPWYPADTFAFIAAATTACRTGATLLLCQPTAATRPGVEAERTHLATNLDTLGLELETVDKGLVRYQTPHFEAVSLRLANPSLPALPNWRLGDLLTLRKSAERPCAHPRLEPATSAWHDLLFGPVRIKIRSVGGASADMASIVPGDVLRNVSRRDPLRGRVGLWTSGNRVYELVNVSPMATLINRCAEDLARQRFTLVRTLDHARLLGVADSTAGQLFDVLLLELQEHSAFERA